jgi:hypothetical protein
MNEKHLETWRHFESELKIIQDCVKPPHYLLFRGHENSTWQLLTTLERYQLQSLDISDYYSKIYGIKPEIEAFTGNTWQTPDIIQLYEACNSYSGLGPGLRTGQLIGADYMAYLRHHGFPSPLLDWTRSPYVAAYFAFRRPSSDDRAIYVYTEMSDAGKSRSSGRPEIYRFGLYPKGHRRHFLQQSEYTVCVEFTYGFSQAAGKWTFGAHEDVFARREPEQDILSKFILRQPSERAF